MSGGVLPRCSRRRPDRHPPQTHTWNTHQEHQLTGRIVSLKNSRVGAPTAPMARPSRRRINMQDERMKWNHRMHPWTPEAIWREFSGLCPPTADLRATRTRPRGGGLLPGEARREAAPAHINGHLGTRQRRAGAQPFLTRGGGPLKAVRHQTEPMMGLLSCSVGLL